jgi:lipopolysaccharide export system protein LptC
MSAPDAFDAPLSRRRRAARPAGRYSRFVNLMKLVLPLMALALLAAIVAWPGMQVAKPGALPLSFTDIKTDDNGLTMASPRYIGTDESGQPFTVTAESATQDKADADRVDMVKPEADMTTKGGTWINVAATTGTYLPKTKMLHL